MQRWSIHLAICLCQARQFGARMLLALATLFIQSAVHAIAIEIEVADGQETLVQIKAEEAITQSAPTRYRSRLSKLQRTSETLDPAARCSASQFSVQQRRLNATKDMRRLLSGSDHSNRNGLGSALLI